MSTIWQRITNKVPLRCPRCGNDNFPSKIHHGLHYQGRFETAREYDCEYCGNHYNNSLGYPGDFR